ncbi:SGNH/GDSL hydrolase family protein [Salipiger sp.]|uniref:SGNH/GDSL hydrolase family protein n=1 Tax=Salipiger sp. TaxID=2078585 RepID=UPI003A973B34
MRLVVWAVLVVLAGCGRGVPENARVVVAGDSVMAWNRSAGGAVADELSRLLAEPVGDVSLPYAKVTGTSALPGLDIRRQVAGLSAHWVVLNGGANDLGVGCDCTDCGDVLARLISDDGRSGAIPALVSGLRARGSRVLWADYYTAPVYAGTACTRPYDRLQARLERLAAATPGMELVDMGAVLPSSDETLFARDRTHPSPAGSARIAAQIAERLRAVDPALR